jgi:hypothetical protein
MNHFLDTDNLKDKKDTDNLIKNNPLLDVRPADFKAAAVKKMQSLAKKPVSKTATEKAVDEQLNNLEDVAEGDGPQTTLGAKAEARRVKRAAELAAIKAANMAAKSKKKKGKTGVTAGRSRFATAGANSSFFANAKAGKDNVQGWANDFDNPEQERNE